MASAGAVPNSQALRDRLAALQGRAVGTPSAPSATPIKPSPARPLALVGGREEATPFGPCYLIEREYTLDHRHGPHLLGALQHISPALLAALSGDPRLASLPLEHLVLIDAETTGLAGGTGTHVFLVGLGFFRVAPDGVTTFIVRQYFLRHLREERALLHALSATLSDFGALVSFNGKSFDWPLLTTRFILARIAQQARPDDWPHLDLLHPARRIWKHRLRSCSLGTLEAEILGVTRTSDVPSALIPELYFHYLRDGDVRPLLPVFAHNETDIISLLALLIHLGSLLDARHDLGPPEIVQTLHGADRYGLATLHAALGQEDASIHAYRAALAYPALTTPLRRAARLALALSLKRGRRWEEAVAVWRDAIKAEARRKAPDPWAHIELAKYFEHIARDYAAAIAITEAAITLLALRGIPIWRDELAYRLARLQRKAALHD
ncbi:MAG TPA: ribonuclease H-like domain-containing protein [Thermomicrobiales bacterium]|jgi:uncharacterized protein YprB with RNaseH-like and TPR domain